MDLLQSLTSITLLLLSPMDSISQPDCVLRKNQDSIKVYTCKADQSKFKAVKARFTVNATYSELASMLLDIENFNHWQYKTIHARVLKNISESELIYYAEVEAPWPVSNRDVVIQMKMAQDTVTKWLTISGKSVPDFIPKKNHLVRVPVSNSKWIVKSINKSRLEAEYIVQIDPGGSVPAWLVNLFAADAPHETFRAFREKIRLHKKSEIPFIVD